jgi:DNA polymerase-3 subunit alpha
VEDNKVFIQGHVQVEEEKGGKLICDSIRSFDEIPKKLWIRFPDKETYEQQEEQLLAMLAESEGNDGVVIYVENPKAKKELPKNRNVCATEELVESLKNTFGAENISVVCQ